MPSESRVDAQFRAFFYDNPDVYYGLVRLAREAKSRRARKLGIWWLYAAMRWETFIRTHDASSGFKLNNNYASRYARLIMQRNPDLAGVFETRQLNAPEVDYTTWPDPRSRP